MSLTFDCVIAGILGGMIYIALDIGAPRLTRWWRRRKYREGISDEVMRAAYEDVCSRLLKAANGDLYVITVQAHFRCIDTTVRKYIEVLEGNNDCAACKDFRAGVGRLIETLQENLNPILAKCEGKGKDEGGQ